MTVTTAVPAAGAIRRPRIARRKLALVGAGAAVVLAVVLTVSHGGGAAKPLEVPAPGGSVAQQLDQLDDAVDHARR